MNAIPLARPIVRIPLVAALAWVALGVLAKAAMVLIDFGNDASFRGASVINPDPNGNYWNSMQPGFFYSNLLDTTNAATTIDFGFSTPVGTDSYNGPAGVTSFPPTAAEVNATDINAAALGPLGVKAAAFDFAAENNCRFEIQQLDPSQLYTLTFFASHKFSTDDATVFRVFSDNTYTTQIASVSLNVQTPDSPNLHNRDTVATISNLQPQASNILYVQFSGANGGTGYLNSLQITSVPEPGSLAFLSTGAALLLSLRRQRA